jgi:hypothetical protein
MKHLIGFAGDALAMPVLVLLVTNLLVLLVDASVVPVPIASKALSTFHLDPNQWRERIEQEGIHEQHERWFVKTGGTAEGAEVWQRVLWLIWPVFLILAVALCFVGWRLIVVGYRASLEKLANGISDRQIDYYRYDCSVPFRENGGVASSPNAPPSSSG